LSAAHRNVQSAVGKYHAALAVLLAREAQHISGVDQALLNGLAKADWLRARSARIDDPIDRGRSLSHAYLLRADAIEGRHDPYGRRFRDITPPARNINVADLDKTADLIAEAAAVRTLVPVFERSAKVDQVPQRDAAIRTVAEQVELKAGSELPVNPSVKTLARQRLLDLQAHAPIYKNARTLGVR
jgi:hypothetical protein